MRARWPKFLAIASAVFAGLCVAAWSFLARDSRWFIERPGGETRLHVGDVHRIAGPWMHFPDGDMYLLYWNLHRLPWLFRWSVEELGPVPTNAATVDAFGRVHANGPGVVDVHAVPRFGRGFAWARFIISPVGQDAPAPVRVVNADVCQQLEPRVFRCKLGPPLGVVGIRLRADRAERRLTTLIV